MLKELKAVIDSLKSKMTTSDDRAKELVKRITRAEANAKDKGGKEPGAHKACFICGGDHLARDCPKKKKARGGDTDADKDEGDGE